MHRAGLVRLGGRGRDVIVRRGDASTGFREHEQWRDGGGMLAGQ